jgi:hypothetical protein
MSRVGALVDVNIDTRPGTLSALSLRVFSDDVTVAGRQPDTGKNAKVKFDEDVAEEKATGS